MKVVIQQLNDRNGYIVTTNDGREFMVKNIDEAIELKEKLQNEKKYIDSDSLKYE